MNRLQITLPVMLHLDSEIEAFKKARERLNRLGDSVGIPIETGAFLLYLPKSSRTSEAFSKQVKNQKLHRLPIRLVETGVQQQNSLAYCPANPTFNPEKVSDLERTIEQAASLRDLDPTASGELVVAPQVGVLVLEDLKKGDFSLPSCFSVDDFSALRTILYGVTKGRFADLADKGKKVGIQLAVENTYAAVFENMGFWETESKHYLPNFGFNYQVFQDLSSLIGISQGNIVMDINHLSAMQAIPKFFKRNGKSVETLFNVLDIKSWAEFYEKVAGLTDYLPYVRAFHISPTNGLSIRKAKEDAEGRKWGDEATDLTDEKSYVECLCTAQRRRLPVAVEVDYNFQSLNFMEADEFLEPLLRKYASHMEEPRTVPAKVD